MFIYLIGVAILGLSVGYWAGRSDVMNDPKHKTYFKKYFENKEWKKT